LAFNIAYATSTTAQHRNQKNKDKKKVGMEPNQDSQESVPIDQIHNQSMPKKMSAID